MGSKKGEGPAKTRERYTAMCFFGGGKEGGWRC